MLNSNRATFVFLLILSVLTLIMIIIILPETMRSIAGDGTLRLSGIYRPLIWTVRKEPSYMVDPDERPELPKITWRTFVAPLTLLMNKSIVLSLIPGGIVYAIWSMVTASTVSLFKAKYQLNELLLGVAFIPNGMRSTSRIEEKILTSFRLRHYRWLQYRWQTYEPGFHSYRDGVQAQLQSPRVLRTPKKRSSRGFSNRAFSPPQHLGFYGLVRLLHLYLWLDASFSLVHRHARLHRSPAVLSISHSSLI